MKHDLNNLLNKADCLNKIKSISGRANTLRSDIDLVAKSAFIHAAEHGDLTIASKLHNSLSKSYHADIKRYFTTFGPVRWDRKSGQFVKAKRGGAWDMGAMDVPFDSVEVPEKAAKEYDRAKELASIVKFLDTKADRAINADDAEMAGVLVDIAGVLARLVD